MIALSSKRFMRARHFPQYSSTILPKVGLLRLEGKYLPRDTNFGFEIDMSVIHVSMLCSWVDFRCSGN